MRVSRGKIIACLNHSNITLEIRNIGEYATTNIYIDDRFVGPSLMSGESIRIYVARPSSPDLRKYPKLFVELLDDDTYTENGLPENLFLQSDDINGRLVAHMYKLNTQDGRDHYCYCNESPFRNG